MSFKSVNEVEKFRYDDCCIIKRKDIEADLVLEVEALIVKGNNSQNTNYTESYADVTQIIFKDATIVKGIKDGMRRYDADDYVLFVEKANEDPYDTLPSDTYQINVHCGDVIVKWDRYLNKVQQM